ncbi:hypothetical protein MS3_00006922 [Schistosoma haematobium]|uniref:PDZ domain-containing protein n=1 Tax=Schistosoma haematobium TaxID=6185 RepID=A0A922IS42_SCHHA|nr:hypothetical protein MS3_00006922 [Schistosoma haematobium]KAH9585776.1 hypothetical protein MS3_00006922 [Schistosoma haematobium]CAH8527062.1 unnamed protein product [Schistosoma haematobium]CAH8529983.1 unnamed protein product [Schistosoma haematobium]
MNESNMLYHRPLYPRMGVQHIHKEFIKLGTKFENENSTIIMKNYNSNKFLKKNSISLIEQQKKENNKLQEKLKTMKNGQILLNTIMPTTRQPIKAKHVLRNQDISELNTSMRNEQNPCNSSITDDVNCWRTTNCDATESKKVVHSRSVVSSPTDSCSCQTIKICPNPDIQRRVSTDGVSLTKSPRFTDLSWSNDKSTPAKRQNIEHSCIPPDVDLSNRNDQLSEHSLNFSINQIPTSDYASMNSLNTNSCLSSSQSSLKKQTVSLKRRSRWSIDITKRSTRRSSTGSLKVKQLDIEQNNKNLNVKDTILESKLERSDLFKVIRRSARRTLSSLCNVLRYSNPNLATALNNSNINDHYTSSDPVQFDEHHIDTSLSTQSVEVNDLVKENIHNSLNSQNNTVLSRFVTLKRPDLNEPFGLFVIKSEQGYRITRLSERFIQNNPTNQISIGDEIIQVNKIDSIKFTIHELQELFQKSQTLLLTIIHPLH